jgi:Na+-translocating ferredoxin:NAD+ oxidoreductase subunit A
MSWLGIIVTFALVDNVILSRLLGICPTVCAPGSTGDAATRGIAIAVLMSLSALAGWALETVVLLPFGLTALRTPAFLFCVVALAFLLRAAGSRLLGAARARDLAVLAPQVAVNCATLGLVLITTRGGYTAGESIVAGLGAGLGYFIVNALMGAIRDRLDVEPVPASLRGFPLQLVSAGLVAYAFMAFDRAFLARLLGG